MDSTLLIFSCLALASGAILCIVLAGVAIRALKEVGKLTATIEQLGADVRDIKAEVIPVLNETATMIRKTDQTLDHLDENLQRISRGTQTLENVAADVRAFEQDLLKKVQGPVDDMVTVLSGTVRGLATLVKKVLDRFKG
jgi:ABC-type transporter Mla subunit MlaD